VSTVARRGSARRAAAGARRLLARAARPLANRAFPEAADASEQWLRQVLDREVEARIQALDPASKTAVEISGDAHRRHGWAGFTALMHPEFDICAPLEQTDRYDVVICEQVLEHVANPAAAAANLHALCAPGGLAIVSTPFLVRIHELPAYGLRDYWRFTPRGLQTLLETAGFGPVEVGSWGNRECIAGNLDRWAAIRPWHPLRNEPDIPVQVWAFAERAA
jgi:SAM-dependent methyltransferase